MGRLAGLVVVAALAGSGVSGTAAAADIGELRTMAAGYGIEFGGAVSSSALARDADYRTAVGREFTIVTPENDMKMRFVQPDGPDSYDWSGADEFMAFARQYNKKVHGHTLVWHKAPDWFLNLPTTEVEDAMRTYIRAATSRYQGQVAVWDVVNEALNSDGTYRDSPYYRAMGTGFVAKAFWTAHTADPAARLVYNDYGIEEINAKSNALYTMVRNLLAAGVPIHGIAMQTHLSTRGIDYRSFADNLRRFGQLGIDVHISEMDVRIDSIPPTDADLQAQADVYWNVMNRILYEPAVKTYQMWGLTDRVSAIGGNSPLILDDDLAPKPAYHALDHRLRTGGRTHTYQLVNKSVGTAAHVQGNATGAGAPVVQYAPQPGWAAQRWTLSYVGSRGYRITNVNSGLALKIRDGATTYGALAEQYPEDPALDSQIWELVYAGGGGDHYALRNRGSGRLLAAQLPGGDLVSIHQADAWQRTGTIADAARWSLTEVG